MGWKLVRDKLQAWAGTHGVSGTYRHAEGAELTAALERKLGEELMEYLEASDPAELYDLLDVIHALLPRVDPGSGGYNRHVKKAGELGYFSTGLMWNPVPEEFLGEAP